MTLVRDALGSVRAEVADQGAIARTFRYAAYGEIVQPNATTPTLLGFAGELRDPSGLIYLRARWYDAGTGRFMSRDPLAGSVSRPSMLNGFAYVDGGPTRYGDPSGECPVCWGAAIGGAAYPGGLAIANVVFEHKSIAHALDGYSTNDLIISTAAGAITGGTSAFVKSAAVLGGRAGQVTVGSGVGFAASALSMATRPSDPSVPANPWEPALGAIAGGAGSLLPDPAGVTGFVRALFGAGTLGALQKTLTDALAGSAPNSDVLSAAGGGK